MTTVTMPQLGETVVEGTITKWLKQEGDRVDQDEPLFEISTDKVDTEVPSPAAGTLTKILVPEGTTVSVKTPVAEIDGAGAAAAAAGAPAAAIAGAPPDSAQQQAQPPAAAPAPAAPTPAPAPAAARTPAPAPAAPVVPAAAAAAPGQLPDRGPGSQVLSPLVRRLASENQVDLTQVIGTGTGGRITKNDVLAFIASRGGAPVAPAPAAATVAAPAVAPQPAAPAVVPAATPAQPTEAPAPAPELAPAPAVSGGGEEIVPMTVVRKTIAEHMTRSLQVSARAWNMVEVDMERIARLRESAKEAFKAREGFNLTYMPFLSRAVVDALLAFPLVNSELRGEEIAVKRYVNLGIAVSYDQGLIVPVVKGADGMNLIGLSRSINDLALRARGHQLKPDEVHGGTFTITNPGPFGSILSVPIINQPQTAILAFDAVVKRPVVIDDAIGVHHMVYVSMSWDHRVIDGAVASQFLSRIKESMETWDWSEDLGQ